MVYGCPLVIVCVCVRVSFLYACLHHVYVNELIKRECVYCNNYIK